MATGKQANPRRTPLEEASDPNTDPERLRELAEDYAVAGAVFRNPSVPEETWRKGLLNHWIEAWDNPMAPIYLIAWTPRRDGWQTLESAAVLATHGLLRDPTQCSTQGKVLIAVKVHEWWDTTEDARDMMALLGRWAETKGRESPEHREVLRILVECVRTSTRLTTKDHQALDLLKRLAEGGEDRRGKAKARCDSQIVQDAVEFYKDTSYYLSNVIYKILQFSASGKEFAERKESMAQHERKLANLIRREMPLPPVVE